MSLKSARPIGRRAALAYRWWQSSPNCLFHILFVFTHSRFFRSSQSFTHETCLGLLVPYIVIQINLKFLIRHSVFDQNGVLCMHLGYRPTVHLLIWFWWKNRKTARENDDGNVRVKIKTMLNGLPVRRALSRKRREASWDTRGRGCCNEICCSPIKPSYADTVLVS